MQIMKLDTHNGLFEIISISTTILENFAAQRFPEKFVTTAIELVYASIQRELCNV